MENKPLQPAPIPVRIISTGSYVPDTIIYSEMFDRRWNKPAGWTQQQCGVESRHVITGTQENSATLGAKAAQIALQRADLKASDIDCIVSASSIMKQVIPCLAVHIQKELGLQNSGIPAFDINATCLSFLVAFEQMTYAIAMGRYRRVLIISSEIASVGLNPDDTHTAPLFGDGAAAVIIESCVNSENSALLTSRLETYSKGSELCRLRAGGTDFFEANTGRPKHELLPAFFEMDGPALFTLSSRLLPKFLNKLLSDANINLEDIAAIIPHQASGKAVKLTQRLLKLNAKKVVYILPQRGNQIAASMPTALDFAITQQKIKRGDIILLLGTGAGIALGGMILKY